MRTLLRSGADINAHHPTNGCTALHTAASHNRVDAVEFLISVGAPTEKQAISMETPLHVAAGVGSDAVRALLKHGAAVNARNADGRSPLPIACSFLQHEVVDILLRNGADETTVDEEGHILYEMIGSSVPMNRHGRDEECEIMARRLARAPSNRAWRRRRLLILCRALSGKAPIWQLKDNRDHRIDGAKAGDGVNAVSGDSSVEGESAVVADWEDVAVQTGPESGRAIKCGRIKERGDYSENVVRGSTNETEGVVAVAARDGNREGGIAGEETVPIEVAVVAVEEDCIFRAIVCFL